MAKYTVTHRCGHDHTYQLFGKGSERDRKQDWLADQLCPTCRREADLVAKAKQNAAAAEANASIGATPLTGTEAQVGYAENIRSQVLAVAGAAMTKAPGSLADFMQSATQWLMDQTSAQWWIETYKAIRPNQPQILAILGWMQDRRPPPPDAVALARGFFLHVPMLTAEIAAQLGLGPAFATMLTARTQQAAQAEHLAARPARPAWLQALRDEHGSHYWNGKIYSGSRIYVANQERRLTAAEEQSIRDYQDAMAIWLKQAAALGIKS
jgi:hypothetical protein